MSVVGSIARFWYAFLVGDDWTIAVAVVFAIAATHGLAQAQALSWWLLPAAVILALGSSLWRVVRSARPSRGWGPVKA